MCAVSRATCWCRHGRAGRSQGPKGASASDCVEADTLHDHCATVHGGRRMTGARQREHTKRLWTSIGAGAVLLYSLAPFAWILLASFTPELQAEYGKTSGRQVRYLPSALTLQ